MIRKIIHIDEEKCNGCGLCAEACHEGAIDIIDGNAKLVRENFCDGFGDCLPGCPTGAITFEEREAPEYDEKAVKETKEKKTMDEMKHEHHEGGCPGSRMAQFDRSEEEPVTVGRSVSRLAQWPCQIKLLPTQAPFFDSSKLLRLCQYARGFHEGQDHSHRLPEAGCGGLHREADCHHP